MPDRAHITVHPVTAKGGRPVTAHAHGVDEPLGIAHDLGDVMEFARKAGLGSAAESMDRPHPSIVWSGGGPDVWE
ncbi:hypothetical protein ACWDYJ_13420 [Streptomyces sp. NPDC003042]